MVYRNICTFVLPYVQIYLHLHASVVLLNSTCLQVTSLFMVAVGVKCISINVVLNPTLLKRMQTNYAFTAAHFLVVIDSLKSCTQRSLPMHI